MTSTFWGNNIYNLFVFLYIDKHNNNSNIGLFFGTQTGNTQTEAEIIQKEFGGEDVVTLNDI
ncbi:hypothetical protein [Nostoc sp.]|uniref:hypothetical protein n=1 Tax=Nostoc sp. TaxID=1180 RepID=UPI003FA5727E